MKKLKKQPIKTGSEIQSMINEHVTRITIATSEQRFKDQVEGWNKCYQQIYEFVKRRAGEKEAELLKQFECKPIEPTSH